ncbi:hypothetical protein G6L37_05580 [Agrobacterium rubi]|nr:hypothetical protein [Agrobacterium rubi]NTF24829.1 hypothetical protein [Agrobacterium rubi]
MSSNIVPVDIDHPRYGRIFTSVLVDPSPRQIARFQKAVPQGQLRGTACNGKLLVYPAWDVTHIQIRSIFDLPNILEDGSDFWIIPADEEPLSSDWCSSEDDLILNGLRLIVGREGDDPSILPVVAWFRGNAGLVHATDRP